MTTMHLTRAIVPLVASVTLIACSGRDDTPIADYLDRLGRSLDSPIAWSVPAPAPLPRARALRHDVPPASLDLLDLLTLADCQLNVTIGKSNSSLGKLASSSQRLLLELEFLSLAPACIALLEERGEQALASTLTTAVTQKRGELPRRIWNATLAGPEFREFWRRPGTLSDYPRRTGPGVPAALDELAVLIRAWLAGEHGRGSDRLEQLLSVVRRGDGGSLLAALAVQQGGLAAATPAVRRRAHESPLCFGKIASPAGRIFDTVVRKFFVGEVQPWAVALDRRRRALEAGIADLETALSAAIPEAYQRWREQRDALWQSSVDAPRLHAQAIGELLASCGLRPGGETR